jgi:energy-coupling factor transport system substrate-specific component
MNPLGWIQALQGLTLVVIICSLLFAEELGIPIFFAPGDLLLAIGGIAIAAGRVNPFAMAGLATVAVLAGATLGRETFALVGRERLMRVAKPLHAEDALRRVTGLLERNGWRGICTTRLIPGLRVYSTQVAGVSRMPRRSFLAGLLPATAIYVAAFVGLGAAVGRPVLDIIHEAEHEALTLALLAAAGLALFILLRRAGHRFLPEVGGWAGVFRFQLDTPGLFVIPVAIGLNFAGHALAVVLGLPLFLDSIGTVLCALLAGPWIAGGVGFTSNLLVANTVDPNAAAYAVVAFAIGFGVGWAWRLRPWHQTGGWLTLWLMAFAAASLLSTPMNIALHGGLPQVPLGDWIHAQLIARGVPGVAAAYVSEAAIDLPDKLVAVVGALLLSRTFPKPTPHSTPAVMDVGAAATYPFRSRRSLPRLLGAGLCILFCWLVAPFLLFAGYAVASARQVRQAATELPAWDEPWTKIKDGFLITLLVAIWALPAVVLAVPGLLAGSPAGEGGSLQRVTVAVASGLSSCWLLALVGAQAAIWSQFIEGGFRSALDVPATLRRLRFHLGLTLFVGTLSIVLAGVALAGFALLLVGAVATVPVATLAATHLFGQFCRMTDRAGGVGSGVGTARSGVVGGHGR